MEHKKLLTWLFLSLLHLAHSQSPPATTTPALEQSSRLSRDAASVDVYYRLAPPQPCLIRPPSHTVCGGLCNQPTMCLSLSPPHIIVCQFLSSGDVGPFPITETQRSRIMAPSCREERRQRQRRSGATPLCCLNSTQSWLQTVSRPGGGCLSLYGGGEGERRCTQQHTHNRKVAFSTQNLTTCHEKSSPLHCASLLKEHSSQTSKSSSNSFRCLIEPTLKTHFLVTAQFSTH